MMGVGGTGKSEAVDLSELAENFLQELFRRTDIDDLPGRLRLERQAIDYLEMRFAGHAAAFGESEAFPEDDPTSNPIDWLRHECHMQYGTAVDRLNVGRQLARLQRTAEALCDGEIGFAHLSVIASTLRSVDGLHLDTPFPEDDLLDRAKSSTPGRLWHHCVRVRHALSAAAVTAEQRLAAEARWLRISPLENGDALISGQLDSIGAAALRSALEPLAQPHGASDDRSMRRRQADALVELSILALDKGTLPHASSQRPHLQVTTTLETLRGIAGSPAAEMEFSRPVSTATVQRLACDASISRIVFGPGSVILDAGRARRVVSSATRRALHARDAHCQWPGCERPASSTAAHHLVHWAVGGATDVSNLTLLCHRHHWMVHEGGWKLARAGDGRLCAIPPIADDRSSMCLAGEMVAA